MDKPATTQYPVSPAIEARWSPRADARLPGAGNQQWAHNAGALILTVVQETFARNDKPNGTARYDVGQAASALALQATELGLRVHQMAGIDG